MTGGPAGGTAVTVNPASVFDIRVAVVTLTLRVVASANGPMDIVTGTVVLLPPLWIAAVTPVPLKMTAFTPLRLTPESFADIVVP